MSYSKEEIIKRVVNELEECLHSAYAEDSIKKVINIDEDNQLITIQFSYNIVEDDDYVGLANY